MVEPSFRLKLIALDEPLEASWRAACAGLAGVEVVRGDIFSVDADAVVSPANSFGFMEGGIDAAYVSHFGAQVQGAVRNRILERHNGELLVGTADIVETDDRHIPFLIAAPTMRVPMRLVDSVNPFLAARAVFLLLRDGTFGSGRLAGDRVADHVRVVAMPGLGTGVGGVTPDTCARQVRTAYEEVVLGTHEMPRTWSEALDRHHHLT